MLSGYKTVTQNWVRGHDTILYYAKSSSFVFNKLSQPHRKEYLDRFDKVDKDGRKYFDGRGTIIYLDDAIAKGKAVGDVWYDIMSFQQIPTSKEKVDYPTQKPEDLLARIIKASSNPGDLIFDCFMGSGTTQAIAMKLGRRFIGADINLGAIQTATKRLIKTSQELAQEPAVPGEVKYTGFSVYNVNNYEVFRNPVEAKELLINALEVQPMPGNILFDGEKDGRFVKIMPVNRIASKADLNELISNFDYKAFEKAQTENPGKPVAHITLVCMGHEPDLAAALQEQVQYKLDIEVLDILRDKANLEFKHDSEAEIIKENGKLVIKQFYPMNLLQKLSLQKETVGDWREMVESIMVDFNYDGAVFEPTVLDVPEKNALVAGSYDIPATAGIIRVKITDLLSESLEMEVR